MIKSDFSKKCHHCENRLFLYTKHGKYCCLWCNTWENANKKDTDKPFDSDRHAYIQAVIFQKGFLDAGIHIGFDLLQEK